MSSGLFRALLIALGLGFAAAFAIVVVPPLIENPDIVGAAAQGFVNPYSSGYSLDVLTCWAVLAVWVIHEATARGVRHGWIALVLGVVPGVATGFAFYLLVRARQLRGA
ncbi:DUF2834 domain-containing protein [Oleomonas cavernae]|uniref:DUF2834 domain-containing protein n=1 Tax=Oleomonas cavernae TaxID=2320859 RepID=A0A418WCH5_9PROT|nr:DUF2834 domain-containing protein [Oleomonas cavernae]RJF87741.1 DUF2834 domain-containing protein [Oleomonas cavernae]